MNISQSKKTVKSRITVTSDNSRKEGGRSLTPISK